MDELKSQLLRFNSIYNDTNHTYHRLALSLGLPDCAFLILYLLRMSDRLYTQSEICELMCLSRQTVNSALKTLAAAGHLEFVHSDGNKKNKLLKLTERGISFCETSVDRVIGLEINALSEFTPDELELLLRLNRKFAICLRAEAEKLISPDSR